MSDIMYKIFNNTENIFGGDFMKKKFSVLFIVFIFILSLGAIGSISFKSKVLAECFVDEIESKSAYLIDYNSKTVIYEKNASKHLPIASMCKIMTLLITFEEIESGNLSFDEDIAISENAAGMGGSQVFLEADAKYKAEELIKSVVVASANDSCVALAERICGSEQAFVKRMNERAKELCMNDTVFVNCTGLPKAGQYSSAKDVASMFSELISHKKYFNFSNVWLDKISHPKGRVTEISNTNKLVRFYDGCDGGKTGYTSEAGHCLSACASRDGMRLVCVVISAPDGKTRFKEVSSMFNFGFANYTNKLIINENEPLDLTINVEKGKKSFISVIPEKSFYSFSAKNEKKAFEFDFKPKKQIVAPIAKGDVLGTLHVYENGVEVGSVNVLSMENVDKKGFIDGIHDLISDWTLVV